MALESAKRDENFVTTILGVDMSTGLLPTKIYVDETTHRLLVNAVVSGTSDFNLTKVGGATFALGQQLAASSLPIVLTAAQMTTLTPPAAITGFLTESDFDTKIGSLTETAPATDTASSGLNGRLQRLAQRLTSIIALLPTSLGQKARASSLAVTLSSEDITAITPPAAITGYATASNQTDKSQFTKITDGTDTALVTASGEQNVLETNSAAIKTAVETIDNAISGSEMQVDVVGALPAGTNAIGKLAANSGVDIGDVDVTSSVTSSLDHGSNLDIDTTAEQITSTSFACKFGVTLKAAATNTGTLYIGDSSSVTAGTTGSTDGFPLEPGESVTLPVNNPNLLYAIASVANQKIFWVAT